MLFRNNCNKTLICEILDGLPLETWVSSVTTFLDPAMASGQFVTEVERRLRIHGHSDSNICGRVFGLETSRMQVNIAVNMNKLVGTYAVDANYEAFLSGRAQALLKGAPVNFDVILGNPPYQANNGISSKLWLRFVLTGDALLKSGGYMSMVVPNSWSKPLSMKPSSLNKQLNDVMFGNTLIDYNLDVSEFFNVGVVTSTFLLRKDGIGAATRFLVSKHQDLAQKILTDAEDCFICADETPWRRFPVSDTPSKNAKFPIRMKKKIAYSEFDDPVRRLPKLIFPRELGYYVFADDVGEYGFNNQGRAMIFETASQVKSAFSFFDSQIVRWIVRTFSWTPQSDFVLLSMIRRPVFDRVFNDEDILNHFNLTKIEQAQIKAALK